MASLAPTNRCRTGELQINLPKMKKIEKLENNNKIKKNKNILVNLPRYYLFDKICTIV